MRVLTVHGWGFCPAVFQKVLPWAEHFSVDHSLGLEENALLLARGVDSDTLLVGWSLGASLAVLAASTKRPLGLVLIGATPHFGGAWKEVHLRRFFKELEEDFERKLKEFRKTAYGDADCPLPPKDGAVGLLTEFVRADLTDLFRSLEVPVFLLHGRKDPITPFREFRKLLKLNPRFEGSVYDGGHFPTFFQEGDWKEIFARFGQLPPLGPSAEGGRPKAG
ncbi:MAG: alpha/beta fold hydrolase [Aquificae bacterium]|nr:alpha/beta fold hydrolase [Aquificota bacterium]